MTASDTRLREFLLGRMPVEDAARLEEAIFATDGVAERLRDEEFDLIDDYAAGRLLAEDRADVERHLLTSLENVHSLRVARCLSEESSSRRRALSMSGTTPTQGPRRRRWMAGLAPLGVAIAAGLVAVALIPNWSRIAPPSRTTPPAARSTAPSGRANPLPIVTLLADVNRGSADSVVHWPAEAASIRLQAEVPAPDRNTLYSLSVYDAAGRLLFETAGLSVHTAGHYRFVDTVLTSTVLGPGARSISLRGADGGEGSPLDHSWHIVGVLD